MDEYEDETQNADPGTAFPIVHPDGRGVQYFGLTMRDYFAAKALQAMTPDMETAGKMALAGEDPNSVMRAICKGAYAIADIMLAERTK